MARKVSNNQLLLIFIGLLVIVGGIKFWQSQQKTEGMINDRLVKPLDSAAIDKLEIIPEFDPANQVTLVKSDGNWLVKDSNQNKPVNKKRMNRALEHLLNLRVNSLISREKKEWGDYQVDSSGTLLKVYQNGKLHDQVVIGKMTFRDQRIATTYIRNKDDRLIYAVEAYLKGSLKGKKSDFLQQKGGGMKGAAGGMKNVPPRVRQKMMQQRMRQQLKEKDINMDSLKKKLKNANEKTGK